MSYWKKLTEKQKDTIIKRWLPPYSYSIQRLARIYKVGYKTIEKILKERKISLKSRTTATDYYKAI